MLLIQGVMTEPAMDPYTAFVPVNLDPVVSSDPVVQDAMLRTDGDGRVYTMGATPPPSGAGVVSTCQSLDCAPADPCAYCKAYDAGSPAYVVCLAGCQPATAAPPAYVPSDGPAVFRVDVNGKVLPWWLLLLVGYVIYREMR